MKKAFTIVELLVAFAILGIVVTLILGVISGMTNAPKTVDDADARQTAETRVRLAEADRQIGMPDITRFTERKLAKDILELRDKEVTTYCYIVNLNGELIFIGEAVGFGIPYSVQFTNPQQVLVQNNSYEAGDIPYTVPQADPNGLFMPEGLSATWIMLKGPDGKVHPVYMEPEIIVSPFPLHAKPAKEVG